MVRGVSIVLGIGLTLLWLVGLNQHATAWLTWFDGVGALVAFGIAGAVRGRAAGPSVGGGPIGLSIGLFVLWIVGLIQRSDLWLTWWTFAFACGFLIVGGLAAMETTRPTIRRMV